MKLKKLGLCVLVGIICLVSIPYAFADDGDDGDDDTTVTVPAHSKDAIGNMLLQSISLMGIPYRWGGNTPETGMDCSGFIRYVFKKSLGINLPRTVAGMAQVGKRVSMEDIEPGDLIFFNTRRGLNTHIGMYIGENKFIQSPRTGEDIQITELNAYWRAKINGVKRIVQEDEDDDGNTTVEEYQDVRDEALPSGYIRPLHKTSSHKYRRHLKRHAKSGASKRVNKVGKKGRGKALNKGKKAKKRYKQ